MKFMCNLFHILYETELTELNLSRMENSSFEDMLCIYTNMEWIYRV